MNKDQLKQEFDSTGFVVVRNLIEPEDISGYIKTLSQLAGDYKKSWTLPDGVTRTPEFWPTLFNQKLHAILKVLFEGKDYAFLQHNDLHVGFSSPAWHRDSVNRTYGIGPDWDESRSPYQLVRVGTYLQKFEDSAFRLGLIPGSHRPATLMDPELHRRIERGSGVIAGGLKMVAGKDILEDNAHWVETNPGDAVIFDPRVLHTGSRFEGVKYSFFAGFGVVNEHFYNHYNYYRYLRKDLGYNALHPDLVKLLKGVNLYADEDIEAKEIEGAWVPSSAYNKVAKWLKK